METHGNFSRNEKVHCKETPTQGFGKIWEPSRSRIILESRQLEESVLLRVWAAIVTGHLPHNRFCTFSLSHSFYLDFLSPHNFGLHWWTHTAALVGPNVLLSAESPLLASIFSAALT